MADDELIEQLAALAHEQWSGWMRYMFGLCWHNDDHTVTIPASLVERWARQMNTTYADLPENEKESDRMEARRVLEVVPGCGCPVGLCSGREGRRCWMKWAKEASWLNTSIALPSGMVAEISRLRALVDEARRERDELRARMRGVYDLARTSFDDPRIAELQRLLIEAQGVIQFGGRTKSDP